MSEEKNEFDKPLDDDSASIKGQGWDILGGGEDDPFGIHSEANSPSAVGENPFADDDEVDAILESIGVLGKGPEDVPHDAFFDRGRGAESAPEPSPTGGEEPEAPPRDLSPEDLGQFDQAIPAPDPVMETPAMTESMSSTVSRGDEEPASPMPSGMPSDAITPGAASLPEEDEVVVTTTKSSAEVTVTETDLPGTPGPDVVSVEVEQAAEKTVETFETPSMPSGLPGDVDMDSLLTEPEPMPGPPPSGGLAGRLDAQITPPEPEISRTPSRIIRPPTAQSFKLDDPFVTVPKPVRRREPDRATDESLEKLLITPERINALWDEIEATFDIVIDDVRGDLTSTEEAIADLKEARELLLAGPDNYDNAEELVVQVRARLRRETKIRIWARTRGTWIFVYLIFWLIILAMSGWALVQFQPLFAGTDLPPWLVDSWLPSLGGGLGGVVGAMWVLIKHIAKKRDFDPIHTPWYLTNPFMGMALGFITYLIMRVSLSGLGGIIGTPEIGLATSSSDLSDSASSTVSITLYLLSVVVGFQQNVLWSLIDRFINTIVPDRDNDEKSGSSSSGSSSSSSQSPSSSSDGSPAASLSGSDRSG